jgi:large conductance mechanosensitive channel
MSILSEFMDFLKEYKVIPLAIAFIMAVVSAQLIKSLVDNIIMGFITPLIPGGDWKTALFAIGPFKFGLGAFLSDLIYFVIVAFVIFLVAKMILKEEKVTKK